MFNLHKKAIDRNCKIKKIADCEINIAYYDCQKIESIESEKLISQYYRQRENFFNNENLFKLRRKLQSDIEKGEYNCLKFKSIIQSLEIANWNNRGPIELEKLKAFIDGLQNQFEEGLCY